jgi:hypothetical protein
MPADNPFRPADAQWHNPAYREHVEGQAPAPKRPEPKTDRGVPAYNAARAAAHAALKPDR